MAPIISVNASKSTGKMDQPLPDCSLLSVALDYLAAGVSIIPLRLDGSKAPALRKGEINQYKIKRAAPSEVKRWFRVPAGIGLLGGPVSGGLEILDFDHDAERTFAAWFIEVSNIVVRLPVVETPSFGFHVLYRCSEVAGSHKIANDPASQKATIIETRGMGGYVVGVGSPLSVHAKPYPYVQIAGPPLPDIPIITPDERRRLWVAARKFDKSDLRKEAVKAASRKYKPKITSDELTPWGDFNCRGDWNEMLQRAGWKPVGKSCWVRPGKSSGTSATLRETADGNAQVLVVFTSSTALAPNTSHSLFSFYSAMFHDGDARSAARELRRQGYGRATS